MSSDAADLRSFPHRLRSLAQGPKHHSQSVYTSTAGRSAHEKMIPGENPPMRSLVGPGAGWYLKVRLDILTQSSAAVSLLRRLARQTIRIYPEQSESNQTYPKLIFFRPSMETRLWQKFPAASHVFPLKSVVLQGFAHARTALHKVADKFA